MYFYAILENVPIKAIDAGFWGFLAIDGYRASGVFPFPQHELKRKEPNHIQPLFGHQS